MTEKNIPKRIEILKKAFEEDWNLEQVNEKLESNFCERLYARNRYEAGLIYAFQNGLGYEKWKALYKQYTQEQQKKETGVTAEDTYIHEQNENKGKKDSTHRKIKYDSGIWSGTKINLRYIKEYIERNSQNEMLITGIQTMQMEEKLRHVKAENGSMEFSRFMQENANKFSVVREKARYYFCKYLYYYIEERCQNYYKQCEKKETALKEGKGESVLKYCRREEQLSLAELDMLKNITELKKEAEKLKSELTIPQRKEYLESAGISYRTLFDRFNYFYFGFITLERTEYLYETYWEFFQELEGEHWKNKEPKVRAKWEDEMLEVARYAGIYKGKLTSKRKEKAFARLAELKIHLDEKEKKLDQEYSLDSLEPGSQRGRGGETYFRDFITGKRDINRDTLIIFLLFADGTTKLSTEKRITKSRLNRILNNCGFAQLNSVERDFDRFIYGYLDKANRQERIDLLYEAAQEAVERGEDFCFRKMYLQGRSRQEELLKYFQNDNDKNNDSNIEESGR